MSDHKKLISVLVTLVSSVIAMAQTGGVTQYVNPFVGTDDQIRNGASLRFVMSSKPSRRRAVSADAVAPLLSAPGMTMKYVRP